MLNILLIENSFIETKSIINFISKYYEDSKITAIATNTNEIDDILTNQNIDTIIINREVLDKSSILKVLLNIEKQNLNVNHYFVIIISKYPINTNTSKKLKNIYYKIPSTNYQFLSSCFQDIHKLKCNIINEETIIKEKISKQLIYLKFSPSSKGYSYLVDLIYIIYLNKKLLTNLNRFAYPNIARKYETTINNIKCNIYHAINNSFYNCEATVYNEYFEYKVIEKPKTIELIKIVLKHL